MNKENQIKIDKLMGSLLALSKDANNYYECVIKILENYYEELKK